MITKKEVNAAKAFCKLFYNGSNRHYHNWSHIEYMLHLLKLHKGMFDASKEDYRCIKLAILFHDCVYDTNESDSKNVSDSIAVMELWCEINNISNTDTAKMHNLIQATDYINFNGVEDNLLNNVITDLDLGILAETPSLYNLYSKNIRLEYSQYSDEVYYVERLKILNKMKDIAYDKNLLFHYFCNVSAIDNMSREIETIKELLNGQNT